MEIFFSGALNTSHLSRHHPHNLCLPAPSDGSSVGAAAVFAAARTCTSVIITHSRDPNAQTKPQSCFCLPASGQFVPPIRSRVAKATV